MGALDETENLVNEIIEEIAENLDDQSDIEVAIKKTIKNNLGKNEEQFINELMLASKKERNKNIFEIESKVFDSISKVAIEEYLSRVFKELQKSYKDMGDVFLMKDGRINANPRLHGFMFEELHALTFNVRAAMKKLNIRAIVLHNQNKNSVDIVLKDTTNGKILQRYQAKCYQDIDLAIHAIKSRYSSQRILVPEYQAKKISLRFPGKTISTKISYNNVESTPMSYDYVKNYQNELQSGNLKLDSLLNLLTDKEILYGFAVSISGQILIDFAFALSNSVLLSDQRTKFNEIFKDAGVKTLENNGIKLISAVIIIVLKRAKFIEHVNDISYDYVLDIVRCVYNITKITISVINGIITPEMGRTQIEQEIVITTMVIIGAKVGAKAGGKIGTMVQPGAGTAVGVTIGSIAGTLIASIMGVTVTLKVKNKNLKIKNVSTKKIKQSNNSAKLKNAVKFKTKNRVTA